MAQSIPGVSLVEEIDLMLCQSDALWEAISTLFVLQQHFDELCLASIVFSNIVLSICHS